MKRTLFSTLMVMLSVVEIYAHDFEVDGVYYRIYTDLQDNYPELNMPSQGVFVTRKNDQNNSYRRNVTIPAQVT